MPEEVRIWQVDQADALTEVMRSKLDLEARIEKWISRDISILSPDLLLVGEQVETASGSFIDLLCIDGSGALVRKSPPPSRSTGSTNRLEEPEDQLTHNPLGG
jgi:hypothetical protein